MIFVREIEPKLKIPERRCPICIKAKHAKSPFKARENVREEPLDLVHTDLMGPLEASIGGSKYLLTIIDDHSRKIYCYPMQRKSDVLSNFKIFTEQAETQLEKRLKAVRGDNGREYVNKTFTRFCEERGIIHETTAPYNPEQNGVAERYNRTIMERVRAMLMDAELGREFWAEAAKTAVYLINVIPKKQGRKSANEKWNNEKIDLRSLRIFGERGYVYIPKEKRKKLEARSKECRFMGYTGQGYRMWDEEKKSITIARDVVFLDKAVNIEEENSNIEIDVQGGTDTADENEKAEAEKNVEQEDEQYVRENQIAMAMEIQEGDIPNSYQEARTSADWEKWKEAMNAEYESLMENDTWSLDDIPDGKKPVRCKWVFTLKRDADGNIVKYKARLVAKGFSQKEGIDYQETFAPVVKYTSMRLLLAIAAKMRLHVTQLDAVTAFLNETWKSLYTCNNPKKTMTDQENSVD